MFIISHINNNTEELNIKQSQFLKQLLSQGVVVKQGSNHLKLFYKDKQSALPRHKGKEIPKWLEIAVLKQLGLK